MLVNRQMPLPFRDRIKKIWWISISFIIALALLAGCIGTTAEPTPTPTKPPAASPKPAPTPTGTLTIVRKTLASENLLPMTGQSEDNMVSSPAYDTLVYVSPDYPLTGKFTPGLATDWKMSADGLTWTFNLRQGVQFHDGWGELTSADVKFIIEGRMESPVFARAGLWKKTITKIDTPDPYTVVVRMNAPILDFTDDLSDSFQIGIGSKKYIEAVGISKAQDNPIGSGPYKFHSRSPGEYVKFEALPNHWRVGVPSFQYIVIKAVPEEAQRVSMLLASEADVIPITLDSAPRLEKAGLKVFGIPEAYAHFLAFGGLVTPDSKYYDPKNPFLDKRVRQAANLAINREEMIKTLYYGQAAPATIMFLSPGWRDLKPYPYDPVKAKQLLAEAGYPTGFSTELRLIARYPDGDMMTKAVAMYWEAIGIKTKLVPMEYATARSLGIASNTAGWSFPFGLTPRSDYETLMEGLLDPAGKQWLMAYDPNIVNMIRSLKGVLDRNERNQIVKKIGQALYDGYWTAPIVVPTETWGLSKQVGTWSPAQGGGGYTSRWETVTRAP